MNKITLEKLDQLTLSFSEASELDQSLEQQLNRMRHQAVQQAASNKPAVKSSKLSLWQPALAFSICLCVLVLSNKVTDSLDQSLYQQYANEQLYEDLEYLAANNELVFLTELEVANWLEYEFDNDS